MNEEIQNPGTESQVNSDDIMSAFEFEQVQVPSQDGESSALTGTDTQQIEPEIDERFSDLPKAEALARTYQSRYDKLYSEYQNVLREKEQLTSYKETLEEILTDEQAFQAFVRSVKPELIKENDLATELEARLTAEFGDFRPEREEISSNPKAWLYYKRMEEIYNELRNKQTPKYKNIQELIEAKRRERLETEQRLQQEIEKVKQKMNWDDEMVVKFRDWAGKLTLDGLAKIFNFAIRTMRVPPAANIPSSGKVTSSAREEFLKSLKR